MHITSVLSRAGKWAMASAMGALLMVPTAWADTTLTVYTALEAEELEPLRKAFRAEYPDIDIEWVRDSTGIITAKVLAEKDNPRADIFYGTSATSLLVADSLGLRLAKLMSFHPMKDRLLKGMCLSHTSKVGPASFAIPCVRLDRDAGQARHRWFDSQRFVLSP